MVYAHSVDIPRLSRVGGHSRRDARGVPGYLQRTHTAVEGGEEGMAVREHLFHLEGNYSTLRIKLAPGLSDADDDWDRAKAPPSDGWVSDQEADRIH